MPGYHLHFLTKDGTAGGHVLNFTVDKAELRIDETTRFSLVLPQDEAFFGAKLDKDKEAELKKVER